LPLLAPQPLAEPHRTEGFTSGVTSLDDWLKRRALANQASGASRTFVVCDDHRVIGYSALASGAISIQDASGRFRRNRPDPTSVAILGHLAVNHAYQDQEIGRALFRDGARRVMQAADTIGIRSIIVHAISEEAKAFYQALGFDASPVDPMTLLVTLTDLRATLAE
jgi:predicted N-acetyltransferase YhbS